MTRKPTRFLIASKLRHRGKWLLKWGREPRRVSLYLTSLLEGLSPGEAEAQAERLRLDLTAARARGEWPVWALTLPAVRRERAREEATRLNAFPAPSIGADNVPDAHAPRTAPERPTVKQRGLYDTWAAHLEKTCVDRWRVTKLAFVRELSDVAKKPLHAITPDDVHAYLDHLLATPGAQQRRAYDKRLARWRRNRLRKGLPIDEEPRDAVTLVRKRAGKPSGPMAMVGDDRPAPPPPRRAATHNHALRVLREFFEYARRVGAIVDNPTAGIKKIAEPPPEEIVVLTHAERRALLEAAAGDDDRLAVYLALYAGLRRAEIMRAEWRHVRLHTRTLRVPKYKTSSEGNTVRTVPISNRLAAALDAVPEAARGGRIMGGWPEAWTAREGRARALMARMRAHPDLSALPDSRFDWHALRHTFCTANLDAGVAPGIVCQWAGHTEAVFWRYYAGHIREYDPRIDAVDDL